MRLRLRSSEWVLLTYFGYTALITPLFRDRPRLHHQPLLLLFTVLALLLILILAQNTRYGRSIEIARDWLPIPLTLAAFREMEWFVPPAYNTHYEHAWIALDNLLLNQYGLEHALEAFGRLLPTYFELCYLLVYGVGTYCIIVLYLNRRRDAIDRFYVIVLIGTLLSYALFPYFPSRPPRIAFPEVAAPVANGVFRRFNLFLLRNATIHTGVFPSAHVSSAFAAAWGMFLVFPDRKRYGWGLLAYAISVAIATVYGRYHYAADAIAGFAVSLASAAIALRLAKRESTRNRHPTGRGSHLIA